MCVCVRACVCYRAILCVSVCVRAWCVRAYVGAVEEVPDGEQRGQDPPEGLVLAELVHPQLQVEQRLRDVLQQRRNVGKKKL